MQAGLALPLMQGELGVLSVSQSSADAGTFRIAQ
jgi:hypothetical protein